MAPLPPRDQKYLWLRYQVEGYTEEIVHDFEQRLKTIFDRQVNRVHILDFEGLTPDLRDPVWRLCHMLISYSISGRGQAPEKVVAADALEAAEDAPAVDEGAHADRAPVQAPQSPPPPLTLMDASGQTYQAFDGAFRGSSPAAFERRTRQRTEDASTSIALHQPDP
nr:hypothetical protein [Tanacetum cinerariifolium]